MLENNKKLSEFLCYDFKKLFEIDENRKFLFFVCRENRGFRSSRRSRPVGQCFGLILDDYLNGNLEDGVVNYPNL